MNVENVVAEFITNVTYRLTEAEPDDDLQRIIHKEWARNLPRDEPPAEFYQSATDLVEAAIRYAPRFVQHYRALRAEQAQLESEARFYGIWPSGDVAANASAVALMAQLGTHNPFIAAAGFAMGAAAALIGAHGHVLYPEITRARTELSACKKTLLEQKNIFASALVDAYDRSLLTSSQQQSF